MIHRLLFLFLALFGLYAHAAGEDELLEPEQAFRVSAKAIDDTTVEIDVKIAEGYYLYKDKFTFSASPAVLGSPKFPKGKVKNDETFGRMEVFPHDMTIRLPLTRAVPALELEIGYQGCADGRVCYPPMKSNISLKLPHPQPPLNLFDTDFLSPEDAFKVSSAILDAKTLLVTFSPSPGYYLYRDKLSFEIDNTSGVGIAEVKLPKGKIKDDPNFGPTEIYPSPVQAEITLTRGEAPVKLNLSVGLQGCAEKGVCYPPRVEHLAFSLPATDAATTSSTTETPQADTPDAPKEPAADIAAGSSDSGDIAQLLAGGSYWLVIASFFGFGLLLALTPCVFPMIPILSGIIVGQGKEVTKSRGFVLSLAYVLGMAVTYAAAGVAAGLSGSLLSAALQNPWVLGSFAIVFIALAFSMFGFYDLQLPAALQSRMSETSGKIKGGNLAGVFFMGALSALIVGPCVAAPLAGALLYISKTHDVLFGGSALFAMALGMGVPLLLVGLSAGALLPRAGGWMNAVKGFFGVLLLAVAVWLVSPVVPAWASMGAWAALLIVSAIYLSALDPLPHNASGFRKFWKGIGLISLVAGIAMLIGLLAGSRDPLQPLSAFGGGSAQAAGETQTNALAFQRVASLEELDNRLAEAKQPVMLDFYADWCVSCKEMERFTFSDPAVQARLRGSLLLQADVTANSAADKALLKHFELFGPPGIVFFNPKGKEIPDTRVVGYQPPEQFLKSLEKAEIGKP